MFNHFVTLFFVQTLCFTARAQKYSSNFTINSIETNFFVSLSRNYRNNGFHRDLLTSVELHTSEPVIPLEILLVETFPAGVYVDPFQLATLKDFGGPDVLVPTFVNVEAPAYKSSGITVFVYLNMKESLVQVTLPIHLRYQKPQKCYKVCTHSLCTNNKFVDVFLNNPSLYTKWNYLQKDPHSNIQAPCSSSSDHNCNWFLMSYQSNLNRLTMKVPVGCIEHSFIVTVITSAVIIIGIFITGYVTLRHNTKMHMKTN